TKFFQQKSLLLYSSIRHSSSDKIMIHPHYTIRKSLNQSDKSTKNKQMLSSRKAPALFKKNLGLLIQM
ncbi:MAG TPA: hypothetical protein DD404_04260, partial [Ruminococcaceae bacterium]|nr:hypothetical protein [Oscillospiraceae bacterium]